MILSATTEYLYDSLLWHAQMGVDFCVENEPQKIVAIRHSPAVSKQEIAADGTAGSRSPLAAASPLAPNSTPPRLAASSIPTSIAAAIAEARTLADAATDLAALEAAVRGFTGCGISKTATNTVFGDGAAQSNLMFIGDAPGAEEDRSGVPFSGSSGQLLDKMLGFIGLRRTENFYISNCLFWRPPGNRQPSADELEICLPLVEKQIALMNPTTLVLVGGTATSTLLRDTRGITRLRGQVFHYQNTYMAHAVPVHVLYHPSYLLRQPLAKKQAWADLLALKIALTI